MLPHIVLAQVIVCKRLAVYPGIFVFLGHSILLALEDNRKRDTQQDSNNQKRNYLLDVSLSIRKISVFPDNVSWF